MGCIKAFTDAYFKSNVQLIDLVHSDEIKEVSVIQLLKASIQAHYGLTE